jgi:HEAT repeat protein
VASRVAGVAVSLALASALCGVARADKVSYFMGRLESSAFKIRFQAAYVLGLLRDARAIPSLVKALRDPHYAVRAASAVALGKLGGPLASVALLSVSGEPEPWVRAEVARALGLLGDREAWTRLVRLLGDPDFGVRLEAVRALGRLGEKGAVLALARLVEERGEEDEISAEARRALRALKPVIDLEEMLFLLRAGGDRHQRARAAVVLGELGDLRALPVLIDTLLDADAHVRGFAAHALGAFGDQRALEALRQLVERERDERVRFLASVSMNRLRSRLGVP